MNRTIVTGLTALFLVGCTAKETPPGNSTVATDSKVVLELGDRTV